MMNAAITAALAALVLCLAHPSLAAEDRLVADLDREQVRITTDFDGAELLLFGTLRVNDNDDIAIIVSGPEKPVTVRRKNRVLGIWINTEQATLADVPSFYHIFSTRPVQEIGSRYLRADLKMGYENVPFTLAGGSRIDEGEAADWQAALARNMEAKGLWGVNYSAEAITIMENKLFRTDVPLPANVLPGWYAVRILHFRDGRLVTEDISAIEVIKSGASAQIADFAHNYAPFYGIFAILFAVFVGWTAAVLFRR